MQGAQVANPLKQKARLDTRYGTQCLPSAERDSFGHAKQAIF